MKGFVLGGESALKRSRGEAGGFVVSSFFKCLAVLSFRLDENAVRQERFAECMVGGRVDEATTAP
jgi:hypothetical protein